jgi:type II secretory pathway component PulF
MKTFRRVLISLLAIIFLLFALAISLTFLGFWILAIYGCILFSFLHYRYGRQEELVQVIITAVETGAPLSSALWAYLLDRPQGSQREMWVATLLFFILPGYYWIWHRRHSYDRKLADVARQLEHGVPLSVALARVPGVASPELRLAVAVGESTGDLAGCLKGLKERRLGAVWVEVAPRFFYPLLLLAVIFNVVTFLSIYIIPKFEKIFADFKLRLPDLTVQIMETTRWARGFVWVVPMIVFGLAAVIALFWSSTNLRWFFPVVGRLYRSQVQSRVLSMLALLLQAKTPAPEALALLAESPTFAGTPRRRLTRARFSVERGETLSDGLRQSGLLSRNAVTLVRAAERMKNLPWALAELGELLSTRAARFIRQLSLVVMPINIVAMGFLVAAIVVGMFLPLIHVLTEVGK